MYCMERLKYRRLSKLCTKLICVFVIFLTFFEISAFNIDIVHPIMRIGPEGSYFGFSVTQHFFNEQPILIVGAPHAESGQPGTVETGAIFSCALGFMNQTAMAEKNCERIQVEYPTEAEFRRPPQRLNSKILHPEGKNHQLLGFTVSSTGQKYGNAMACAPLLRYGANAYTDGACYLLSSDLNHTGVISTCNSLPKKDRHNDYGACEQGFSAFLDKNVILSGLPGARKWTGGVFGRYEFTVNGFPDTVEHWTMEVNKEQGGIINILTSHDYLGYSVAYGRFGFWYEKDDGSAFTIVSGATRFQQTGGVVFLPFRRHTHADEQRILGLDDDFSITGTQLGSGFGASLLVIDLNNDGFDDLIVGAPYEFFHEEDVEWGGAVYVFYSSGIRQLRGQNSRVFEKPIIIRATSAHSQFGYSLARLANIDNDPNGYQDFIVGAPQADNGKGAVFVYYGASREAFNPRPAQEIYATNVQIPLFKPEKIYKITKPQKTSLNSAIIRNFGASLAGGVDLDGNGYGDLAVGAFGSDMVFLFLTRPVIDIQLDHSFAHKYIKIDDRRLANCPSSARNCFTVTTSLKIIDRNNTALILASMVTNEPFMCRLELIPYAKGVTTRGLFINRNQTFSTWPCGREAIRRPQERVHEIYVPQNNQDWTNALRFNFTITMRDDAKNHISSLLPVVNINQASHLFDISFDKKCGDDNDCHTDLVLSTIFLNITRRDDGVYMTKVTERDAIIVRYVVENRGERAFNTKLFQYYDANELDQPQLVHQSQHKTISANIERKEDGLAVLSLGNPFEEGKKITLDLSFNLVRGSLERVSASLLFEAIINSTSVETAPEDNKWSAEVQLIKEADLQLDGVSQPAIVRFSNGNPIVTDEEDIGPQVVHIYTLTNHGPFYAKNVTVTINWPLKLNSEREINDWALYTLEVPVIRHNGELRKCSGLKAFAGKSHGTITSSSSSSSNEAINPLNVYNDETLRLTYEPKYRRNRRSDDLKEAEYEDANEDERQVERGGLLQILQQQIRNIFFSSSSSSNFDGASSASIFAGRFLKPKDVEEISGSRIRIGDINCEDSTALCVTLVCGFDYIGSGDSASIEIRARLWNYTFANDYKSIEYFALTSNAFVHVDATQGIREDIGNNFARVSTHAYPDRPAQDDRLAWWMLALAALAGLLLLTILVLICRRCGFFKRKRRDINTLHTAMYRCENEEFFG